MTADQQKRVLVVDDHADIRALLGAVLRQLNLTVDEAEGGAEAIRLLGQNHYSVILLDLMMPDVDGYAVLDRMGGPEAPAPTVVLVITGADRPELNADQAGMIHGIVKKPFDAQELGDLVLACTEMRSRSFGTMAIATMIAGTPFLALLNRLGG